MSFIKNMDNRFSFDYRFSVTTKTDDDLISLRKMISEFNERYRKGSRMRGKCLTGSLLRVSIMARGPRAVHARRDYNYPGAARAYDSSLPHQYAEYFDVYVHEDSDAMYYFRKELETGLTRANQRKISDLKYEIMKIEWEAKDKLKLAA